jgi:hypothetical protein
VISGELTMMISVSNPRGMAASTDGPVIWPFAVLIALILL